MVRFFLDTRRYRLPLAWVIVSVAVLISTGCGGGGGSGDNSGDNGGTLPRGKNISGSSADSLNPVIAADSEGDVYVAWEEANTSSTTKLYLAKSGDAGTAFSTVKDLSMTYCSMIVESSGDVLIMPGDSGSAYISWVDRYPSSGDISEVKFLKEDGPSSSCTPVSDTFQKGAIADSPRFAVSSDGKIHMAWAEGGSGALRDVAYRYSGDEGASFQPPADPAGGSFATSLDSSEPLLAFEGSLNVDMVWVEGSKPGREVVFSRSEDGGENFSIPLPISGDGIDAYCPVIAASEEGKIFVAYKGEGSNGGGAIYFARWQSATSLFSSPVEISSYPLSPSCPEIAVSSSGVIYVLWEDAGGIWIAISSDSGISFAPPKDVSFSEGSSSSPVMAVAGSHVNIVWVEEAIGRGDIFFTASQDNGRTFLKPAQIRNLSNSSSPSHNPAIATDGWRYIYVAWEEGDAGSREIYFLRDEGSWGVSAPEELSFARFLDISGDGKSDVVIGAPLADDVGKVYIFTSNALQSRLIGTDLPVSDASYTLSAGSPGDQFGYAVAIGGDINGDGYSDILVGAPYADDGAADNGKVYIYYGNLPNRMDTIPDIMIRGVAGNDHLGISVSPAGDVNGDGFDDIIIGAPDAYLSKPPLAGAAYIFYGGPFLGDKPGYPDNLSADDADVILMGEASQDKFGSAVSWAGDFNGDGYGDVVVGAPLARVNGIPRGRAYIYLGGPVMNADEDVTITAAASNDRLGSSVARAGDVDANGCGDVVVGAPYADAEGTDRGAVYIIYGHGRDCDGSSAHPSIDLSGAGSSFTVLNGSLDYGHFGISVGYGGKVNGDSYDDVIVGGLYQGMDEFLISGRAYIYFGGQPVDSMSPLELIGAVQTDESGSQLNTAFGSAVAGAGDVNGDGYYDVLVGAFLADQTDSGGTTGTDTGKVYLYTGGVQPDNNPDATFTGDVEGGQMGYSLYKK